MSDILDLYWQSSLHDIKQGYTYIEEEDKYVCLICGQSFTNGVIYQNGETLYEAQKYSTVHITEEHGSAFQFLLSLDKKLTGLTDHQRNILNLFHKGYTDNEVARELGTNSTSTVRNHRFTLRERQKQAKIFLAIMELLNEQLPKKQSFIELSRNTQNTDNRFVITTEENEKILSAYFKQGLNGPLDVFPLKEKKRITILRHLITRFDVDRKYTEKEVNEILKRVYHDYALLRRLLIEYGFMDRTKDGSSYWIKL